MTRFQDSMNSPKQHEIQYFEKQEKIYPKRVWGKYRKLKWVAMIVTLGYAQPYLGSRDLQKGEYYTLSMFTLLGILVMISANNFLVVYLGLELMSLSLYALVAMRRDHGVSTEAAMKFFVLGALASGLLLYGM